MNRIITNTLVACILLISLMCTSCTKEKNKLPTETTDITSAHNILENSSGNGTLEAQTKKEPAESKRIIYYSSSLEYSYDYLSKYISENVELRPYDSRFESSDITVIKRADAPAQASITLDGKTYTLDYKESSENTFLGYDYDEYSDGTVTFRLSINDRKLLYFCDNSNGENGNLSKTDALKKSEAIISELYGTDTLNKFDIENITSQEKDKYSSYIVTHTMIMLHCCTDVIITIEIDTNGSVRLLNAPMLDSSFETDIAYLENEIYNANNFILDNMHSTCVNQYPKLIVDSSKNYYFQCEISLPDSNETTGFLCTELVRE